MSGEVVSLDAAREERQPHASGAMICMACRHEHVAVAPHPPTVEWYECPACHAEKAHWKYPFMSERITAHWHCNCGNSLFYATHDGFYCPNCGSWQRGF